ncbi:uncharacterized protein LOC110269193 [Arachis ipaensis]|uniref:uncharacterized protein LOC110269193 n=1 Tax=Arachis ipaensis TaxID=130454 RepID=UPI000A2B33BC|nr:uncharacterized protein LOC110269193 [Arachis ipaensis]
MDDVPEKCGDPDPCLVTCTIDGVEFVDSMCDLGACVSIMPLSVYEVLKLPPLKWSAARFILADKSIISVVGIAEDVLVSIKGLVFPIDFHILKIPPSDSGRISSILLGRPFLKISRFKLDVFSGTYSFEIDGREVSFKLDEAMRHPPEDHSIFWCDLIDNIVAEVHQDGFDGKSMNQDPSVGSSHVCEEEVLSPPMILEDKVPSHEQNTDLKPLPTHLKYVFLEENQKFPVIIARELISHQEEKLLNVLRRNKKAIGWSLADLIGISPQVCEHQIFLEEGAKPVRQPQRHLNPIILEVVKKEVTRLLEADIIYPISDSEWVSPVQVVPKKSGVTTIKNEQGELIATRVQNSWRICIDYRCLNLAIRKDHFLLPFIDQMLDRLCGKSHYCFLDGYSGYFQIHIAPGDQEKTTFTCPFVTYAYKRMLFGLCNAPATFQRCMMSIFADLLEHCMEVFMDDFSIYGDSFDLCLDKFAKVLERCTKSNLVLDFEKCHFTVRQCIILGHIVSNDGISIDLAKVNVISSMPYPSSVREIRAFLGHACFYR